MMRPAALVTVAMIGILSMVVLSPPSKVIYVDDDAGPLQTGSPLHPFADIQQAIDAAPNGATIRIAVGYYTPFLLDKPLYLQGASIDNVRVVSEDGEPSAVMSAGDAVIEGLSFLGPGEEGAPTGEGLRVDDSPNVLVLSCKFPFFEAGIVVQDSEVTLSATILEYGGIGALLNGGGTLHASSNLIVNNGTGIDCTNGEVESWYDYIEGNGIGIAESCGQLGF